MAKVLIIDDDRQICEMLSTFARREGHLANWALNLGDGHAAAKQGGYDLVFLDVRLPDGNGLDLIPKLRELDPTPVVVIMTGYADPDGAELAIRQGAWDYLQKDSLPSNVKLVMRRASQFREETLSNQQRVPLNLEGLVGSSPAFQFCLQKLAQAAASRSPVLLSGETGTGKEVLAAAIHRNSRQADQNFVVVDCASIPETLAASVLFGHRKGAFTGADRDREGLIQHADQGVLFLDEMGELPLPIQKNLLRVLDTGRYRPIGSKEEYHSNFRLIAATNQQLESMVAAGQFREDLYFRLKSFHINLPPLRERENDIKLLAAYYLDLICEQHGLAPKGYSAEFLDTLYSYPWPGNVRELINALHRAVGAAGEQPTLFPWHLPVELRVRVTRSTLGPGGDEAPRTDLPTWRQAKKLFERDYLRDLMSTAKGRVKQASRISGLSPARIYELLKKHQH